MDGFEGEGDKDFHINIIRAYDRKTWAIQEFPGVFKRNWDCTRGVENMKGNFIPWN